MARKNQNKKIADCTIAFGAGLAALIFSTQFFPLSQSYLLGGISAGCGIGVMRWAWRHWQKI